MRGGTKVGLVGVAAASVALALLGLAGAQTAPDTASAEPPPKGPFVDFCPTAEQVEAHQRQYGFDYKPTVACTSEGEFVPTEASSSGASAEPGGQESDEAAKAREKAEKAFLESLRRAPDTDGNPATIESVDPGGREVLIIIQTGEPELFKGMTPAEFAEKAYP